jgi:hexosaminidase
LNTDWGDNGHLQPLSVSYIGFLAGAAMSWKAEDAQAPLELPVAEWLEALVLDDSEQRLGKVARDLGNAYREMGCRPHNSSALFFFVAGRPGQPLQLAGVEPRHFDATLRYLELLDRELAAARPGNDESRLVQAELAWASDLLKAACRIGRARLELGFDKPVSDLPRGAREALAAELAPLVDRHRALWLRRNRPGGLADSAAQLERVLGQLSA